MLEGKGYRITPKNVAAHELIGLKAEVIDGTENTRIGLKGFIVDETKNLVVLETAKGIRKVPKAESVFELDLGSEKALVKGKSILARPEDRTKLCWRNKA